VYHLGRWRTSRLSGVNAVLYGFVHGIVGFKSKSKPPLEYEEAYKEAYEYGEKYRSEFIERINGVMVCLICVRNHRGRYVLERYRKHGNIKVYAHKTIFRTRSEPAMIVHLLKEHRHYINMYLPLHLLRKVGVKEVKML